MPKLAAHTTCVNLKEVLEEIRNYKRITSARIARFGKMEFSSPVPSHMVQIQVRELDHKIQDCPM
jgi:hypothetical protein